MADVKPSGKGKRGRLWALLYLGIAIAAALGTATLLTRYMDARVAAVRVPTERVVVAAVDVPLATALRAEHLAVVNWPQASMPEGVAHDPAEVIEQVVVAPLSRGEPILKVKLLSGAAGRSALATQLRPGKRAMAVRVDDVVGVAGFIHPGDRVDVIATLKFSDRGDAPLVSKTILQNIRVLAVGKEIDSRQLDPQKPVAATVATLAVDADQAEKLAWAGARGQVLLTLRGATDDDPVHTSGAVGSSLYARAVSDEPPPSAPDQLPHKAPTASQARNRRPTPASPSREVEILRGDLFERRDFQKGSRP
jgi:pilus assembly protein CpaB